MNIRNKVTSQLAAVTTYDPATGEITGLIPGNINLGSNANVIITGGTDGQVLVTDGTGVLSWENYAPTSNTIINGNSNVLVNANSSVTVSSDGVDSVLTVDETGTVSANSTAQSFYATGANGIILTGNVVSSPGNITIDPLGDGSTLGTLTILGNASVTGVLSYVTIANSFTDNLLWIASNNASGPGASAGSGLAVGPAGAYGKLIFNQPANKLSSSIKITSGNGVVAGGAITGATTGAFSGAVTAASLKGDGGNLANITGANVVGNVALATVADSANSVAGANVTGEVAFAFIANSVAGANVTGAVPYASTANSVAGANVIGAVAYTATANSVAAANVVGQVANALVVGTVTANAQPNITSLGTLTGLTSSGNLTPQLGGYFVGDGGYVGNLQITAGSYISNATSNLSVTTSDGNVDAVTNGAQAARFDTTGNVTANGIAIANGGGNGIGFLSRSSDSTVMLGTTNANMAIRDWTNGPSTTWFDLGVGGGTSGRFQYRTTSSFNSMMTLQSSGLNITGVIQNSGNTINMSSSGTITAGYLVSTGAIQAQSAISTPNTLGNFTPKMVYVPQNTVLPTLSLENVFIRTIQTTSPRLQPQISAVSGSYNAYVTGYQNGAGAAISVYTNSSSTTYTAGGFVNLPNNGFVTNGGDMFEFYIIDNTNTRTYRVTIIHGNATNSGSICIERIA